MDRNQAVGLFLISALVFIYMTFFAPKPDANKPVAATAIPAQTLHGSNAPIDSAEIARQKAALGSFGAAASGNYQTLLLENENLKVTLSNKGGAVEEVL